MSAIKRALTKLNKSIEKLDAAMYGLERSMAGRQRDMFGGEASNENDGDLNGHVIDGAIIAQRLDQAIEKVETILKEAAGG